ncbi:MAG: hypothetical protein M9938_10955 [Solirubrobacterales bacterium]|nr:hypothetical protein [Solirubrobacterales bacterium]
MNPVRTLLVVLSAIAFLGGSTAAPAIADGTGASVSVSAKAKKKCKRFKGKKKRQCLKRASRGKGGKPWAGSPYRPKMTCAFTPEMQKRYARYGLTCIVISPDPYLTTLIPLKGPVQ